MSKKRENIKHLNPKASAIARGIEEKLLLTGNTFCRYFNCGKNRAGYWDGNHASVQLEDCVDFFFTLLSPNQHQLIFELDPSQSRKGMIKMFMLSKTSI